MEIRNLEKLPERARKALAPFLEGLFEIYGDDILSVFAYGSVTGPDYCPKTSDVNVAVVLKNISLGKIKKALKLVKAGLKRKITVPLFLTPAYIKGSLDSFPMEFVDMKDTRLVFYGEDTLAGLEINAGDLRRECECQLKGKLLMIRQAYLEQALTRKGLERLIKASFRALIPVFRNVLRIKGESNPPLDKAEIIARLGEEFGLETASFLEVLKDKKTDGRIGERSAEEFLDDFLDQLELLSEKVDKLG